MRDGNRKIIGSVTSGFSDETEIVREEKNAAIADEVRRTFVDLDRIDSELKKAAKAIISASGLVAKYRGRLQELCESAVGRKMPTGCELSTARIGY